MRDWGFTPVRGKDPVAEVKHVLAMSIDHGFRNRPVRWAMLAAPFTMGVGIYGFYAMQPYLLELYGNQQAYVVAGLAAALTAGAQIVGGMLVPHVGRFFRRRTSVLLAGVAINAVALALIGLVPNFWAAIALLSVWGLVWSASIPIRSAYLNGLIPSAQRATVLSFDNLMASSGGVVFQPVLGRVADASGYGPSYVVSAGIQLCALPFVWLSRAERMPADTIEPDDEAAVRT
jgi:MFS family permease